MINSQITARGRQIQYTLRMIPNAQSNRLTDITELTRLNVALSNNSLWWLISTNPLWLLCRIEALYQMFGCGNRKVFLQILLLIDSDTINEATNTDA